MTKTCDACGQAKPWSDFQDKPPGYLRFGEDLEEWGVRATHYYDTCKRCNRPSAIVTAVAFAFVLLCFAMMCYADTSR